jgi:hypothetical protein
MKKVSLRVSSAFCAPPRCNMVLLACLLLSTTLRAAVTGVVMNGTTGKPQAGATVALNKLATATGIELVDQAKSGPDGSFTINQTPQGPHVIRTAFDGVTYNHMLPPGAPTTNLRLEVYNASKNPGEAKVSKHMILFEPAQGQMTVNETMLLTNPGKTAWNDASGGGTVQFFLPAGASGKAEVKATAPNSVTIGVATVKTSKPDVYAVDFPIKPGDSRIDITYSTPYTSGEAYAGKVPSKDENTYLIVPAGITLAADGLNDLGAEPKTQAHIYGLAGNAYNITLTGEEVAPAGGDTDAAAENSGPQIEQIMPRVYGKAIPILAIALGILALGFVLLYRHNATPLPAPAKETNERGRR